MAAYNPAVIQGYLAIIDNPPTNAAKGKAFEDLACYLLNGIPGVKITARNESRCRRGGGSRCNTRAVKPSSSMYGIASRSCRSNGSS